jgi:hypothetical protein
MTHMEKLSVHWAHECAITLAITPRLYILPKQPLALGQDFMYYLTQDTLNWRQHL